MMHRLARMWTWGHRRQRHCELLIRALENSRRISAGSSCWNENEGNHSGAPRLRSKLTFRRRRPLSPLERISGLLSRDVLSPEVDQLLRQNDVNGRTELRESDLPAQCDDTQEESGNGETNTGGDEVGGSAVDTNGPGPIHDSQRCTLPGERLLAFGEILTAECLKGTLEFRKMFQLKAGSCLNSRWGVIEHSDIAGQPAGRVLHTNMGVPLQIHRASLEEYVLFMKRGPAITYPKDAVAMLMMMDVTEGDCVLEAGSGSGAMSLFMSRAVGSKGSVVSVEVRDDHYRTAVQNYQSWRASWRLRRGEEWPDNVRFHKTDLCVASSLLAGHGFHAVALDLADPHLALQAVIPHLQHGAVCAVYLTNITQIVELLDALRLMALPLQCECVIEVPHRAWLVAPVLKKDGSYLKKKALSVDRNQVDKAETSDEADKEFTVDSRPCGSVPYIARPDHEQMSHTAFLVKLRKIIM
ncbi:tRNA (adenine(58)-N(1))-methyltransferase, mitochondrial isoform X2 [Thalassophryne amazonica]|uniref:tRNA (adenine(58)-N(1))-methyltransferase, mitochondrial isoform X2 n=1 Tax=Thalassophryne amazonica TaxID=390379 RepID=UPI001470B1D2|nr:tRNA (adenine(58)-N(1))-methyltransferase, mitochondrial isoform X2 [Thalassophryne amazonica]